MNNKKKHRFSLKQTAENVSKIVPFENYQENQHLEQAEQRIENSQNFSFQQEKPAYQTQIIQPTMQPRPQPAPPISQQPIHSPIVQQQAMPIQQAPVQPTIIAAPPQPAPIVQQQPVIIANPASNYYQPFSQPQPVSQFSFAPQPVPQYNIVSPVQQSPLYYQVPVYPSVQQVPQPQIVLNPGASYINPPVYNPPTIIQQESSQSMLIANQALNARVNKLESELHDLTKTIDLSVTATTIPVENSSSIYSSESKQSQQIKKLQERVDNLQRQRLNDYEKIKDRTSTINEFFPNRVNNKFNIGQDILHDSASNNRFRNAPIISPSGINHQNLNNYNFQNAPKGYSNENYFKPASTFNKQNFSNHDSQKFSNNAFINNKFDKNASQNNSDHMQNNFINNEKIEKPINNQQFSDSFLNSNLPNYRNFNEESLPQKNSYSVNSNPPNYKNSNEESLPQKNSYSVNSNLRNEFELNNSFNVSRLHNDQDSNSPNNYQQKVQNMQIDPKIKENNNFDQNNENNKLNFNSSFNNESQNHQFKNNNFSTEATSLDNNKNGFQNFDNSFKVKKENNSNHNSTLRGFEDYQKIANSEFKDESARENNKYLNRDKIQNNFISNSNRNFNNTRNIDSQFLSRSSKSNTDSYEPDYISKNFSSDYNNKNNQQNYDHPARSLKEQVARVAEIQKYQPTGIPTSQRMPGLADGHTRKINPNNSHKDNISQLLEDLKTLEIELEKEI